MLRQIEENSAAFSAARLGRWLGWAQCAATVAGVLSLDEAKMINKANETDPAGKITDEMILRLLGLNGLVLHKVINLKSNEGKAPTLVLAEALNKEI